MHIYFQLFCLIVLTSFNVSYAQINFRYDPPKNFSLFLDKNESPLHPVSTSNEEAQRYFNQGLTLFWAFNQDASYWSFKRAAELDPNLAMAYWGMALAIGPNLNRPMSPDREQAAFQLIQKAQSFSQNATGNEKAYIQALSNRYTNQPGPDDRQLNLNYIKAMKNVVDTYPDDLDAAALYAEGLLDIDPWNLWDKNKNPREFTIELLNVLDSILKRDPDHLGANHYYIHAVEFSSHPEWGLMSAERLRHLLPKAGHILHMPSHIYIKVGEYYQAAQSNTEAISADKAYIRNYGFEGFYPLEYLTHNLYFLANSNVLLGRYEEAKKAAEELVSIYSPYYEKLPDEEFYISLPFLISLRFHNWQDVLEAAPPSPQMHLSTALWHFARSFAFISQGDEAKAEEEQSQFVQKLRRFSNPPPILTIANLILEARFAEMKRDIPLAIQRLNQAMAIDHNLNEGFPEWLISLKGYLGGIFLRNGQYKDAELIFRKVLGIYPRYGQVLFGLLESLKGQLRYSDAFWIEREYKTAWKYSTIPLNLNAF